MRGGSTNYRNYGHQWLIIMTARKPKNYLKTYLGELKNVFIVIKLFLSLYFKSVLKCHISILLMKKIAKFYKVLPATNAVSEQ